MRIITKEEFKMELTKHLSLISDGAIFIYPTDTIYGIGCNATDGKAVSKIRDAKKRPEAPFSVIAPSKEWIEENCAVTKEAKEWVDNLPGPYTLILKLKNKKAVAKDVIPDTDVLGVRIPNHWFSGVVKMLDLPIITTSVNEAGKRFITSLDEIEPRIAQFVDFAIDEGEIKGKPSNVINLAEGKAKVRER